MNSVILTQTCGTSFSKARVVRGTRRFVATMLAPAFFFLMCFYLYPTVFNIANSLTDLSLFGLKRGGAWVGVDNYIELVTNPDFRRVLWNTVIWLTVVGVTVRLVAGLGLPLLLTSRTIRKYGL
jgi:multiple sugar transport system permease protein